MSKISEITFAGLTKRLAHWQAGGTPSEFAEITLRDLPYDGVALVKQYADELADMESERLAEVANELGLSTEQVDAARTLVLEVASNPRYGTGSPVRVGSRIRTAVADLMLTWPEAFASRQPVSVDPRRVGERVDARDLFGRVQTNRRLSVTAHGVGGAVFGKYRSLAREDRDVEWFEFPVAQIASMLNLWLHCGQSDSQRILTALREWSGYQIEAECATDNSFVKARQAIPRLKPLQVRRLWDGEPVTFEEYDRLFAANGRKRTDARCGVPVFRVHGWIRDQLVPVSTGKDAVRPILVSPEVWRKLRHSGRAQVSWLESRNRQTAGTRAVFVPDVGKKMDVRTIDFFLGDQVVDVRFGMTRSAGVSRQEQSRTFRGGLAQIQQVVPAYNLGHARTRQHNTERMDGGSIPRITVFRHPKQRARAALTLAVRASAGKPRRTCPDVSASPPSLARSLEIKASRLAAKADSLDQPVRAGPA